MDRAKERAAFPASKATTQGDKETFFPACSEDAFVCSQVKSKGGTLIVVSYMGWRWGVGVPHDL